MKRILCSIAGLALICTALADVSANNGAADPIDGVYRVTDLATPSTAQSCNFGPGSETFFPDKSIVNNGDGTYTQDYLFPGTNISICDQPGSVCSGLECTLDGKFADCGNDPLVVNFGFLGFDATVTFGAPHDAGNSTHTFWPGNDAHMSKESSMLECTGADCPILAFLFFGPEFSFPCGDVNSVVRYDLED